MTKTFCDICLEEKEVTKRRIIIRTSIDGTPIEKEMETCDACYQRIINAQVKEFQSIREQAVVKEDI